MLDADWPSPPRHGLQNVCRSSKQIIELQNEYNSTLKFDCGSLRDNIRRHVNDTLLASPPERKCPNMSVNLSSSGVRLVKASKVSELVLQGSSHFIVGDSGSMWVL